MMLIEILEVGVEPLDKNRGEGGNKLLKAWQPGNIYEGGAIPSLYLKKTTYLRLI